MQCFVCTLHTVRSHLKLVCDAEYESITEADVSEHSHDRDMLGKQGKSNGCALFCCSPAFDN